MIVTIAICIAVGVAALTFYLFFTDFEDFIECISYYFTPDIISLFRGELEEDFWASLKLFAYFAIVIGAGASSYLGLGNLFGF